MKIPTRILILKGVVYISWLSAIVATITGYASDYSISILVPIALFFCTVLALIATNYIETRAGLKPRPIKMLAICLALTALLGFADTMGLLPIEIISNKTVLVWMAILPVCVVMAALLYIVDDRLHRRR